MAIKKYGCFLKDGRFIQLSGGFAINKYSYGSDSYAYINESVGDDFFPDLKKQGDVQIFSTGAKAVVKSWIGSDRTKVSTSLKYFDRFIVTLYDRKGGVIGDVQIDGSSMQSSLYYQTNKFVVGVLGKYDLFKSGKIPPDINLYKGTEWLGNNGNLTYLGDTNNSTGQGNNTVSRLTSLVDNGTYKQGFFCCWIWQNESSNIQPPINKPFNYFDSYLRAIWLGNFGEYGIGYLSNNFSLYANRFYKFLGEVGIVERSIGEDLGEKSSTGGQDGTYTDSTDIINVPSIPNVNASSCGLVKMYELTVTQAVELGNYLWSAPTEVIENLKKIMVKPMDSIISLQLSPINPPLGGDVNIKIGGMDSGVVGKEINNQYLQLDCGTVEINKYWGSCLDFSPYTKASIYLPMIGTQILNVDDIMGKKVGVIYNMDLLSGSVVAFITANGNVLYSFQGVMNSQIPLTGADNAGLVSSTIGLVASGAVAFASGGASVPLTATVASGLSVMNSKQNIQRGGNVGASGGLLAVKYPYITLERAVQSLPNNFKHYKGYTSNITTTIGMCKGYTEISYIDLNGIGALKEEIEMLNDVLKGGFYA